MTIDPSSKFLFVVDSYAPGFNGVAPPNINPLQTNTVPTQGCVVVYPISSTDGSLGTPVSNGGQNCFPIGTPVIGVSADWGDRDCVRQLSLCRGPGHTFGLCLFRELHDRRS